MSEAALLRVRDVVQEFEVRGYGGVRGGVVHAVSGVSLDVREGETVGVVGESGSGKSTLVRSILQVPPPKSGEVWFRGVDLTAQSRRSLLRARRHMQTVFQDPFGSLDPKWTVFAIVQEPLDAYRVGTRAQRRRRVEELLDLVGLSPAQYGRRRPTQLSGGQCQRVAIARALALDPSLLICDEAVSSLDVLSQAQVLNLFEKLRAELGLAFLFVAHDLALVRQVSDRVAVMYLGRICEIAPVRSLFAAPRHHYTTALLDAIPSPTPVPRDQRRRAPIAGEVPSPVDPPSGCRFRTRCPRAEELCAVEEPPMTVVGTDHAVACHFPLAGDTPRPGLPASPAAGSATAAGPAATDSATTDHAAVAAGRTTTWNE